MGEQNNVPEEPQGIFWGAIRNFFVGMFNSVWSGFVDIFKFIYDWTIGQILALLNLIDDPAWITLFRTYQATGLFTEEQYQRLIKLKNIIFPFNFIALAWVSIFLFLHNLKQTVRPASQLIEQSFNEQFRPELPNYQDVIRAAFIAPERTGEIRKVMKRLGFTEEAIELLFISAYNTSPVEEIRLLYLRGVLSPELMFERMRENGYTDTRIKEIIQGWEIIPSPQDLVFLSGKEAFEPDIIAATGLDQEFPSEQLQWFQKQGISEDWARKYWIAHWQTIPITQGFEMLHRGVITIEELDLIYRFNEIPPHYRDKLTAISYRPLTRVDARRMHDVGVLDINGLNRAYLDQGYSPDNAALMTRFTVEFNEGNNKELTKAEVLKAFRSGAINDQDAVELLMRAKYQQGQAQFLVGLENLRIEEEITDAKIDVIGERFMGNFITEVEALSQIHLLNIDERQVRRFFDLWKVRKLQDVKIPSKDDLKKFLLGGQIEEHQYKEEMRRLGYNEKYINWYFLNVTKVKSEEIDVGN